MTTIHLQPDSSGSGQWTLFHPKWGLIYQLDILDDGEDLALTLVDLRNDKVIDEDSFCYLAEPFFETLTEKEQAFISVALEEWVRQTEECERDEGLTPQDGLTAQQGLFLMRRLERMMK